MKKPEFANADNGGVSQLQEENIWMNVFTHECHLRVKITHANAIRGDI